MPTILGSYRDCVNRDEQTLASLHKKRATKARWIVAGIVAAVCSSVTTGDGLAGTTSIWTNSASSSGPPLLQQWDLNGNLMRTIIAPHGTNGRGIVQVGNVLYYTSASSNDVWGYNIVSNTDLGSIFTVAGEPALASLASDGPNLYIQAYSTSRRVYKYTLGGSLVWSRHICPSGSTIHPNSACDGLEYSSGKLISNRGDGVKPYDVYGTNGSLLTPAFIVDPNAQNNTGIACDGTNYYVSRIYGQIAVYDLNGVYQNMITLNGGTEIEDISVTRKGGKC